MKKTLPFLKEEYFGNMTSDKILFDEIHKYIHQYNVAPTQQALKICVGSLQITQDQVNAANKLIDELFSIPEESNIKWLVEKTEEFCQDKALYNAIHECIKLADKTNSQNISKNQIPTILKDALAVSFDPNIGHDYFEDLKKRYDAYTNIEDKIPFDLKKMNEITKNGVPRKTLNCIAAETGKGKSIWLCHHAANCLRQNKNVLYITLEMSEYKIAERIDANLMNITIEDLQTLPFNLYEKKLQAVKSSVKSKLIIKEYPTASANAMHFRHLLDELKLKLGFVPDVIMVDYINICASSKYKTNAQTNSYTLVKSIAEELRALAIEQNVAIWTATQLNRSGFDNSDVSISSTAESMGLPNTLDFYFALIQTEELEKLGQVLIKQFKNRYNDKSDNLKFILGLDKSKMKFYDVNASAQSFPSNTQQQSNSKFTKTSNFSNSSANTTGNLESFEEQDDPSTYTRNFPKPKKSFDDWD